MSAFLGPIHYWLFNKIKLQNQMVEALATQEEQIQLQELYGSFPEGNLEDHIDTGNIHGWLQELVSQVEYKLASVMKGKDPETVKQVFRQFGEANQIPVTDPSEVFKLVSDVLLDGMPCDHANSVVSQTEDEILWKKNICVHTRYWNETGSKIELLYEARDAFIEGLLTDSGFVMSKPDDSTTRIRRMMES